MAGRKKRGALSAMLEGLLDALDWLVEGVAGACMGALRALARLGAAVLCLVLRGIWFLLCLPVRVLGGCLGGGHALRRCLRLSGAEFEAYVALVLGDNGFRRVELTGSSGDQGVDILAERNGRAYAIQCKNYAGAVGNFAVQEAYAGARFYGCECAAVICPGTFTRSARELARATGVLLWDGNRLLHMIRVSGRRPGRPGRRGKA